MNMDEIIKWEEDLCNLGYGSCDLYDELQRFLPRETFIDFIDSFNRDHDIEWDEEAECWDYCN